MIVVHLLLLCTTATLAMSEKGPKLTPPHRIAFGSCHSQLREPIWDLISFMGPNQLVLLGDNIYADKKVRFQFVGATTEEIARHYCTLNGDPSWQRLVTRIGGYSAIDATWDDHDMGLNDGDASYAFKNESMKLFFDFFRIPSDSPRRKRDGVYYSNMYEIGSPGNKDYKFKYKLIMLDVRYNMQSSQRGAENPDILGEQQWHWLDAELKDPEPDLILLGSSLQILPTGKLIEESWYRHAPKARDRLLRLIASAVCQNVILLSGDVHGAEISQVLPHRQPYRCMPQLR